MKIALAPEGWIMGLVERAALALGLVPAPFLALNFLAMGAARTFLAGSNLGIFDALDDGPKNAAEIARRTGCSERGTESLLKALNGFGYVRRRGDLYRNSPEILRWHSRSARFSMRDTVGFMGELWNMLGGLEDAVRSGEPENFHHNPNLPPSFWENYERALATFGRFASIEIVRRFPLAGADGPPRRILDVGGGHGVYSMAFCKRHPTLRAEILDLPQAADVGEKIVAEAGMSDRVACKRGDLRSSDWGEGFDAVLLFNLLHTLSPEDNLASLRRAKSALRPGGKLLILDAQHVEKGGNLKQLEGFHQVFFYLVAGGARAYSQSDLLAWTREAGFASARAHRLLSVPNTIMLSGIA